MTETLNSLMKLTNELCDREECLLIETNEKEKWIKTLEAEIANLRDEIKQLNSMLKKD